MSKSKVVRIEEYFLDHRGDPEVNKVLWENLPEANFGEVIVLVEADGIRESRLGWKCNQRQLEQIARVLLARGLRFPRIFYFWPDGMARVYKIKRYGSQRVA